MHPHVKLGLLIIPLSLAGAVAARPLESSIHAARQRFMSIDDLGGAVVVTLSEEDRGVLTSQAVRAGPAGPIPIPDFDEDPLAWRALHARLLDQLVLAEPACVAFDMYFTDAAPDRTTEFIAALDRAAAAGVPVGLGTHQGAPPHALYESGRSHAAILDARRDSRTGLLASTALLGELGGQPAPSLFLQAFSLAETRSPATAEWGRVVAPPGLPTGAELLIRYPRRAHRVLPHSHVLLAEPEKLIEDIRGRTVFVGLVGRWAASDVWQLPFVPEGQLTCVEDGCTARDTYGVFVQAAAFNQLQARSYVRRAGAWSLLLIVVAAVLASLPPALMARRRGSLPEIYASARPASVLEAVMHIWPWPQLLGVGMVIAAVAATWTSPVVYPVAGVIAAALAAALSWSLLGLPVRRRARRLVDALVRVDDLTRQQGSSALVRLPPGGPDCLFQVLASPAVDRKGIIAVVSGLHAALVEDRAGRTFQQAIPRMFFAQHGWLEPTAGEAGTRSSGHGAGESPGGSRERDEAPVAKADELCETFCGTALRRIRNLWAHSAIKPHAARLGHDALRACCGEPEASTAASRIALQRTLVRGCVDYLDRLAAWLEEQGHTRE